MSREQKQKWIALLVGSIIVPVLAWSAATVDDRYVHVSQYRTDAVRDSAWKAEQRAISLDVLCNPKIDPRNRRCR